MTELWIAIILGVIEGVTEFLPISSTGHLLLAARWMDGWADLTSTFWVRFVVFIQIGAIAAVVVYFRDRLRNLLAGRRIAETGDSPMFAPDAGVQLPDPIRWHPILLILIATVPVLIAGFLLHNVVEQYLETPKVIATALIIGGVLMIAIELLRPKPRTQTVEDITLGQAIFVGCVQILAAVFPGTSRSAATIMGGLVAGLSRPAAAEFSFFLAIPAMCAACGYALLKMLRSGGGLTMQQVLLLVVGTLVSFLVAFVVIAVFMRLIRKYSFIPFAIYRIILGCVVLWLLRNVS
ncbi:MAG TPA: undecaprenyl-diphosphate phosphatase [Tepidisphaeraceae bacterium]|nr:undecaprenyl-diphosphate phosphatase [Tepidisphaeraceae bacterium]